MSLDIFEIKDEDNSITLTFQIDEIEDGLKAQRVLRSLIVDTFNLDSKFGYDNDNNEVLVFSYSIKSMINILSCTVNFETEELKFSHGIFE